MNPLDAVFNAKSVAVVGASQNPEKTGHIILRNIIDGGFGGEIYPINPKGEEILGARCYSTLSEVDGEIDVVVIVVPAKFVPGVMEEAGKKRVKGAVVISGGFSEIGNEELQEEVVRIAAEHGVRVIGPNCQGFNYTPNHLCASWPLVRKQGPIAVISQSGTVGATLEMWAEDDEIGISSFVALGNKCDVSETDLIEFFAEDPNTKVISLYIEGVKDGRVFMDTVTRARRKKPIVVLKPGKTHKGMRAVQSHTHSIAGKDEIFDAVCKQTGIVRANDITELYDYSKALGFLKKPAGNRLLIVTSSGGCGIIATDTAEEGGIDIVGLSDGLKKSLTEALPSQCVVQNPLDLTGDTPAERYKESVEIALAEGKIDAFLLIFGDPIPGACEVVKDLKSRTKKPIVVSYLGGGEIEREEGKRLHQNGTPVFQTPERAVRALCVLLSSL
ncbi:MAG: CoA-binding protein [Spirochaetes bacterium]|nr:CoA-binding protein [Spirochaetota bacterium]